MIRLLSLITIILALTSCARMSVQGTFSNTQQAFKGGFSSSYNNKGRVFFTTDTGLLCEGRYRYDSDKKESGTGTFTCLDRTIGDFTFTVETNTLINGMGNRKKTGKGFGKTNRGEDFTFSLKG